MMFAPNVPLLATLALATFVVVAAGHEPHRMSAGNQVADHDEPLIRTLYQYPKDTWIENIAVRANGSLLLTLLNTPHLDTINPFEGNSTPHTIFSFEDAAGVSGIGETEPDIFVVAAGNLSFSTGPVQGSWSIWSVDLGYSTDDGTIDARKIVKVPGAIFLDGLCILPSDSGSSSNILVGDAAAGLIYFVETTTGKYSVAINDTLTAALPLPALGTVGVNGIHVVDKTLYFTNTGKGIFAKMPISTSGSSLGTPNVIARTPNTTLEFDDFAIKDNYAYLVTGSGNSIERIGLDGTPAGRIIVGSLDSTQIAEPTSCAFGRTPRDRHILYVVTTGGLATPVDGDVMVGAQVLAVDTQRWARLL